MLIRSLVSILILALSLVIVTGQTPDAQRTDAEKAAKSYGATVTQKQRDIDLNVLFDSESFRGPRKTSIDLKNVTAAAALDYILLQEGLYFEEAGPKTILVASRFKGTSIPSIGVGVTPLTKQLAHYFGVDDGILINNVLNNSPASNAQLLAGDVIVEIDGIKVNGALGVVRAINDKNESDVILTIVRDRDRQTIRVTPEKGIKSVLQKP